MVTPVLLQARVTDTLPADTAVYPAEVTLEELTVRASSASLPVRGIDRGEFRLNASALTSLPSLAGHPDPIRAMQALPAVTTNSELVSGIFVQGCDNSMNATMADGARIINPQHMLGLFSVFNTPHFREYELLQMPVEPVAPMVAGAVVTASSPQRPDSVFYGTLSAGLIDSQATLCIPLARGHALSLSGRVTYTGLLFGEMLKLDGNSLGYGFQDYNLTYTGRLHDGWNMKGSLYAGFDRASLTDDAYDSHNTFGWHNIAGAFTLSGHGWTHTVRASGYANRFSLNQGDEIVSLPSSVTLIGYEGSRTAGRWTFAADVQTTGCAPQRSPRRWSGEGSLTAGLAFGGPDSFSGEAVISATVYGVPGFIRVYPRPRLSLSWSPLTWCTLSLKGGMYLQTLNLVAESTSGLPTDFWISASRRFRPLRSEGAVFSASGHIGGAGVDYVVQGYMRHIEGAPEYDGALLNLVNTDYDPLSDVRLSSGYTWGLSLMAVKRLGPASLSVCYNLGFSRMHFPDFPEAGRFPSAHDRRHDLKINGAVALGHRWSVSASFALASGYPFTEAAYGYMIGENLICEYYPHNSSRLPMYSRLDLGAKFIIWEGRHTSQSLSLSVYNALCHKNVLFTYVKYSPTQGIHHRDMALRLIIPSLSYTITFR